jgi:superoxide dismutase, Cu-Zn family
MEAPQEVSPLRIAFLIGSLLCLSLSWMVGCSRADEGTEDDVTEAMSRRQKADATARLAARPGTGAHGFVRFIQTDDGVRMIAELAGMPPGQHGIHVHEKGDCSAPDFSSAGEHFTSSPQDAHGMPADEQRHTGDLGNIVVDGNGTASLDRKDEIISIDGDRSIIGRALIVHERGDDGADAKSAGGRLLCGVIERADLGAIPERSDDAPSAPRPVDEAERVPAQPRDNTIPPLTPPPPLVP